MRAGLGQIAVADRLEQQLTQRLIHEELGQHVEALASKSLTLTLELLEQALEDLPLARVGGHEVPHVADLGLSLSLIHI